MALTALKVQGGRREEGRREGLEEALFVIVGRGGWRRKRELEKTENAQPAIALRNL
jgi:hypothetical protein